MIPDAELLRRYLTERSEPAFAELVRRHLDLVYNAALRRTGSDPHRAGDVAQEVFTSLARHARALSRHPALSAWLHTATRNAALNLMLSETRRQARDSALLAKEAVTDRPLPWEEVRPLLDDAIDRLSETDRTAVVLRFLEKRAYAEIGNALHISEDAARMRTERALDRLRNILARRGIVSTAAALGTVVSAQPFLPAPAALATTLATQSWALVPGSVLTAGIYTLMSLKLPATAVLCILAGLGAGLYIRPAPDAHPAPVTSPVAADSHSELREENRRLAAKVAGLDSDVARLTELNAQLRKQPLAAAPPAVQKDATLGMERWEIQRAVLNNLRQISAAVDQFALENGSAAGSVSDLVGRTKYIKALRTVAGEDYTALSMAPGQPLTATTPSGIVVIYDPNGRTTTVPDTPPEVAHVQELGARIEPIVTQAVSAYRAANDGKMPPNENALLPYFTNPTDSAEFSNFIRLKKSAGL